MWLSGLLPLLIYQILLGYWYLSRSNLTRLDFDEQTGYRVTYESAIKGFFVTFFSTVFVLALFFLWWVTNEVRIEDSKVSVESPITVYLSAEWLIASIVTTTLIYTFLFPKLSNLKNPISQVREEKARSVSIMASLILDAQASKKTIRLVTSGNEVYEGWVIRSPSLTKRSQINDFALVPAESGYRDENYITVMTAQHLHGINWSLIDRDRPEFADLTEDEIRDQIGIEASIILSFDDVISIQYGDITLTGEAISETN